MRKIMTALVVGVLSFSLTGCIPSGNIVGKANFTTVFSSVAQQGDVANVQINGGIVATPKGLRVRLNNASLYVNGVSFIAASNNYLDTSVTPSRDEFAASRLKGKNACGTITGFTVYGNQFSAYLFEPEGTEQYLLILADNGFNWYGFATRGSLKLGGRNLCGGEV